MMDEQLSQLIKRSIDLHLHVGPEVIPRTYTARTLAEKEAGKLGGAVMKNHFLSTAGMIAGNEREEMRLFGGIVLNNYVGGLNPDAIYASASVAPCPLFVWMPTLHTQQFLEKSVFEIPPEWTGSKDFKSRPSSAIKPVVIAKDGKLAPEVMPVLKAIAEMKAVLCTGHISADESLLLARQACELGISKIVITHPIYQKIAMPVEMQKELASMGCLIEHCYSMYSIDRIPIQKMAEEIAAVGPQHIVVSSDVGQSFSPSPSQALKTFARLLMDAGLSFDEIETTCATNPRKLVGLPDKA